MTRSYDAEFVTRHLAGLASLEAAIVFAARALVNSFPTVCKVERSDRDFGQLRGRRIRSSEPLLRGGRRLDGEAQPAVVAL
jgi:hypothetical protein